MSSGTNLVHHIFSRDNNLEEGESRKFNVYEACGTPMVIMDGDTSEKWSNEKLEGVFGIINKIRLTVKEVENTLSAEVFHIAMKSVFTSIAKDLAYTNEDLASTKFAELATREYDIISASSKKTEIARNAQGHINFENMTDEAKRIAKEIYLFICRQNGLEILEKPKPPSQT